MPVSNEHLKDVERVWDGETFQIVKRSEAKKMAKAGTHQIATKISAAQLKRKDQFKAKEEPQDEPEKARRIIDEIVSRERSSSYQTKVTKPA